MISWKLKHCFKLLCFLFVTYVCKISSKRSAEMPLSKAVRYKRFDVALYMKELRLARDDVERKRKLLRAKNRHLN